MCCPLLAAAAATPTPGRLAAVEAARPLPCAVAGEAAAERTRFVAVKQMPPFPHPPPTHTPPPPTVVGFVSWLQLERRLTRREKRKFEDDKSEDMDPTMAALEKVRVTPRTWRGQCWCCL